MRWKGSRLQSAAGKISAKVLINVAEQVVGRERPKALGTPWTAADEEVLGQGTHGTSGWLGKRCARHKALKKRLSSESWPNLWGRSIKRIKTRHVNDGSWTQLANWIRLWIKWDLARFYAGLRRMGIGFPPEIQRRSSSRSL